MIRNPKGCDNIGGALAANMEECRGALMHLFSLYGYHPFSPAEFQLIEDVWGKLSTARARRLIPVMSPLGEPCVLRGDLTLSAVAYLAGHHTQSEWPLRLSYADRVYSVPAPPKSNLEESQVGVELIGCDDEGADAEAAALLFRALDLLGIENSAVVLGDGSFLSYLFSPLPQALSSELADALSERAYTRYSALLGSAPLSGEKLRLLKRIPLLKGNAAVIGEAMALLDDPGILMPLRRLCGELCSLGYERRLRVDLSFVRDLGYYSGPIYNAYSADGALLGGGGRYDGLLAAEGIGGQAVGFGLNLKELASHCAAQQRAPLVTLWCGGCKSSDALRYADALSKKDVLFELSWTRDAEASRAGAKRRGSRWWADLGAKSALMLARDRAASLKDFEEEALSC